ncbi:hypothetical protein ACFL1E_05050 [Candidatus Omnitrophota bacterium]
MPQINLLSPSFGKKLKQKKQAKKTISSPSSAKVLPYVYISSGVTIVVLICLWVGIVFMVNKNEEAFASLEKQEAALKVDPKYLVKIKKKRDDLKKRVQFLQGLSAKNFFWNKKLDDIANVIPYGVFLNTISLNKRIVSVAGDSEEKKEELLLSIKGIAVAFKIKGAVELVEEFYGNLKNEESFAKDFSDISTEKISKSVMHGRDIMQFEIVCAFK